MDSHSPQTPREKMHQYWARLRASGLRPMQIWVHDTRARGFAQEVQRQSHLVSASKEDQEILDFIGSVVDEEGWGGVKRGDLVIVAAPGDYGKPRPAVVIQTDMLNNGHVTILVCLLSGDLQDAPLFRIDVAACEATGLANPSQIMADKIVALKRNRITQQIGRLDDATMLRLNRSLAFCIGLA